MDATYTDAVAAGNCANESVITRTWSLTDDCNNTTTHVQTITVQDITKPEFTAPADVTINCEDDATDLTLTGDVTDEMDNCSSGLDATYTDAVATGNCANESVITRTWSLNDGCDNITSHVQIITIVDDKAPELVTNFSTEVTASCADIPDAPEPSFIDNCSTNVTVNFTETTSYTTNTSEDYEIIRKWEVKDACENVAVFEQVVTVTVDEFVTQASDERCYDDGIIDLNDYVDNTNEGSNWTFVSGVTTPNLDGSNFDPSNLEDQYGDYVFSYTYTSDTGCLETTEVTININDDCIIYPCTSGDVVISKAVTPNGDSYNESFDITGITADCNFTIGVKIFNRWGALIFEDSSYTVGENKGEWRGQAHKSAIGSASTVPNGTYYYIITLKDSGLAPFTGPVYVGTK
ncbi:gliding motility-associated C-terminal domain-containing protein [Snuella sp. CAU 1569]|uniref:Gliding motility-associated C-terminal domain-containing protein n=1 Tax=Snuella sedimenti TaxID=2798802 RepID=A0A8J7LPJ9_9FLAO|nr:gliding motility-associated C-terminal domain-containing protein [Snuella sedimenti]MBJ6369369.1 gliding motility-associated C-terminal domain-containing protein [Snuella sedimenti]